MEKSNKVSPEVLERAVRMVQGHCRESPSLWAAVESIAPKFGYVPQTLNEWVKRDEFDNGVREGLTTGETPNAAAQDRAADTMPATLARDRTRDPLRLPQDLAASETATQAPVAAFPRLQKLVFISGLCSFFGAPKARRQTKDGPLPDQLRADCKLELPGKSISSTG